MKPWTQRSIVEFAAATYLKLGIEAGADSELIRALGTKFTKEEIDSLPSLEEFLAATSGTKEK